MELRDGDQVLQGCGRAGAREECAAGEVPGGGWESGPVHVRHAPGLQALEHDLIRIL